MRSGEQQKLAPADAAGTQLRRQRDGGGQIVRHGQDQRVGGRGRRLGVEHPLLAEDVEQARQSDGDADARQPAVRVILREVVVTAAGADRADLGVVKQRRLIHRAGVVVEPTGDGEVDREVLLRHAEAAEVFRDRRKLVEPLVKQRVLAAVAGERGEHLVICATDRGEAQNIVRLLAGDGKIVRQNGAHAILADLLQLVHRAHDIAGLLREAQHGIKAVQNFAVVDTDLELFEAETGEHRVDDRGNFRVVRDVQRAVADDVDVRLIELTEAAALSALAAVDLADLVAPERKRQFIIVQRNVLRQRHGEVEAQAQIGVALRKAVDLLLRLAAAFGKQDLAGLEQRRVQRREAVERIGGTDRLHDALHLLLRSGQQLHKARQGAGFYLLHRGSS